MSEDRNGLVPVAVTLPDSIVLGSSRAEEVVELGQDGFGLGEDGLAGAEAHRATHLGLGDLRHVDHNVPKR